MEGGELVSGRDVFVQMTTVAVYAAIGQAYGNASIVRRQDAERVLLEGVTRTGMVIRMVLNTRLNLIETAWPTRLR